MGLGSIRESSITWTHMQFLFIASSTIHCAYQIHFALVIEAVFTVCDFSSYVILNSESYYLTLSHCYHDLDCHVQSQWLQGVWGIPASAIPLKMTCCYTSAIVAICSGVIWRACKSRMLLEVCEVMQHFNILQEAYRILPKAAQSYDEIRNIITSQM